MSDRRTDTGLLAAVETLSSQRTVVDALGGKLQSAGSEAKLAELAGQIASADPSGDSPVLEAMALSLAEIAHRQRMIADLLASDTVESIALDALAGAMHRVRTCLDVAMGSVEEVGELGSELEDGAAVAESATEAIRSLRLVYHYTHELNEMATIKDQLSRIEGSAFDCVEVANEIAGRLSAVAEDCGVKVEISAGPTELPCNTDQGVVKRILRQVLLLSIVSPGVSKVTLAIKLLRMPGGGLVTLRVTDDGKGLSLLDRAAPHRLDTSCNDEKRAADLAGFAVARRMAKAIGGKITLEYLHGRASRAQFSFPAVLPEQYG